MDSRSNEAGNNLKIAENYYRAILAKDFAVLEDCLHDQINFISPLAELHGKEAVIIAAKNLSNMLHNIEIRSKFSQQNKIAFIYDFMFAEPIGKLRAAVLMEFTGKLIAKIELFYDGRPFEQKRHDIFSR